MNQCESDDEADEGVDSEVAGLAVISPRDEELGEQLGCSHPHIYLSDSLRSPRRMLIAGYDEEHYESHLVPGRTYTVHGAYEQRTRGFISTEDGLLVAHRIEGEGLTPPEDP